jgi:hypothetical protein
MSRSTKHSSIPKSILNLDVFQPERLKDLDDDALDVALHLVHPFVRPDTVKFVLEVAMEREGCIEFLLSCESDGFCQQFELYLSLLALSQDKFDFVSKWVNDVFPCDLDDYSSTSICARLISTVSVSLLFLHHPNDDERAPGLDTSHRYVALSNTVLQALAGITQSSVLEIEDGSSKVSQKARKYAKRTRQANKSVDMTSFRALDLEVPTLRHEAKEMALEILMKQRDILLVTMFAPSILVP